MLRCFASIRFLFGLVLVCLSAFTLLFCFQFILCWTRFWFRFGFFSFLEAFPSLFGSSSISHLNRIRSVCHQVKNFKERKRENGEKEESFSILLLRIAYFFNFFSPLIVICRLNQLLFIGKI